MSELKRTFKKIGPFNYQSMIPVEGESGNISYAIINADYTEYGKYFIDDLIEHHKFVIEELKKEQVPIFHNIVDWL
ncbi:MAG: hypothetical protein WC877_01370 [Dehalococcoidales bacterium]|jgi:hypothetical protein